MPYSSVHIIDTSSEDDSADSRTAMAGRKRKQPPDLLQRYRETTEPVRKHQKSDQEYERSEGEISDDEKPSVGDISPITSAKTKLISDPPDPLDTVQSYEIDEGEIRDASIESLPATRPQDLYEIDEGEIRDASIEPIPATRLQDLSPEDQALQIRYFNITNPSAPARCLSCGKAGHTPQTCPSNTCIHCGSLYSHFSSACPKNRKCTHCRQRGHSTASCKNRSKAGGGIDDPCDICGGSGHVEEECTDLWCTYIPNENNVHPIHRSAIRRACYNCGSDRHWGDDCPTLPPYVRKLLGRGTNVAWSEEYAGRFISNRRRQLPNKRRNKYGNGSVQGYQLAMLDDGRD